MKLKLIVVAVACSLLPMAAFAADPAAPNAEKGKRDGEGRKQYLINQHKKIDDDYKRKIEHVENEGKMTNSGARDRKIKELERERDEHKQRLTDHYNKGPKAKGD